MPNWCYNKLIIVPGEDPEDGNEFDRFKIMNGLHPNPKPEPRNEAEKVLLSLQENSEEKEILSFERAIPTPEALLMSDAWYDWRVKNWGTKWDAVETTLWINGEWENGMGDIPLPPNALVYRFETAWAPPSSWLGSVSEDFPEAIFHLIYTEEMGSFAGMDIAHKGQLFRADLTEDPTGIMEEYGM